MPPSSIGSTLLIGGFFTDFLIAGVHYFALTRWVSYCNWEDILNDLLNNSSSSILLASLKLVLEYLLWEYPLVNGESWPTKP